MSWWGQEWHKVVIGLLAVDHLIDRGEQLWNRFKRVEDFVDRRHGERRKDTMSFSIGEVIADVEKAKALLPQLEAIFADGKKLAADVADLEAAWVALNTPPTAPPTGKV